MVQSNSQVVNLLPLTAIIRKKQEISAHEKSFLFEYLSSGDRPTFIKDSDSDSESRSI